MAISYRFSGKLLSYFFKLGAEHIHSPVGVHVTGQRDVKPVALFALNDTFREVGFARRALSRLRDHVEKQVPGFLDIPIYFGPVLNSINTHDFLRVINPIKNAPVAYP